MNSTLVELKRWCDILISRFQQYKHDARATVICVPWLGKVCDLCYSVKGRENWKYWPHEILDLLSITIQ